MLNRTQRAKSLDPKQVKPQRSSAPLRRNRTLITRLSLGAVAAGALASLTIYLELPDNHRSGPPKPVSTVADNKNACLLADANQPQALAIFADLREAAATLGDVNVRQTTLPPQTTDAAPELAGLIQQRCNVIYALGPLSTSAAKAAAINNEDAPVAIIAITDRTISATHLTTLPLAQITANQVATSLTNALRQ